MAARYYVLVSEELLDSVPPWEALGLHLIEQGALQEPPMRWCVFDDDNAPAELTGKKVELHTELVDGVARISERRVTG